MTTVTRFAPSPTGYLHIGGARTALFNWLFAKHTGGQFLLRVEDTDKERSTEDAKRAILEGLNWLGLHWDGAVHYQSEYAARHAEVAHALLDAGKAYRCYCTQEELDAMRDAAKAEGRHVGYDRRWRDRDPSQAPAGAPYVVRIKAPLSGDIVIEDAVQGTVRFAAENLDDFVILRSDGSPTYMLAVVVDDHDMGVTHIIRGDDHLNNAARQAIIYDAMGWNIPVFAHIPLIHGADGAKLSKRHGALGVEAYRDMGYLQDALRNYLLRLGFSHGNDEIISTAQAIEWFDLSAINKGAARMDFDKLANLNGHYIRAENNETLVQRVLPYLNDRLGKELTEAQKILLVKAIESLKQRAKLLPEIADAALFLFHRPEKPADEKAAAELKDGREILTNLVPQLADIGVWSHDALNAFAKSYAEAHDLKLGKVMSPIRVAITGSTASPSMFEVMEWLGKDESLARLKAAC